MRKDYPLGYLPAIDGIRGLMPFGVLAAHIEYQWFPGGIVFMNVFFILSAYLITTILLKDLAANGNISFRKFYIRRVLRLFPANYMVIAAYLVCALLLLDKPQPHFLDGIAAASYVSNWTRAFSVPMPNWLAHTWSLSIEEQYYLLWPPLLALLVRFLGTGVRLIHMLLALIILFAAWRYYLAHDGASILRLYNGTDVRADTLLIGCVVAILLSFDGVKNHVRFRKTVRCLFVPLAILIFCVLGFTLQVQSRALYTWGTSLIDLCVGVFVIGLITSSNTVVHRIFETKALVFLGKMSYSTYLWHFPIFMFMKERFAADNLTMVVIGMPLTYLCAYLSFRYIETPFLASKRKYY